MIIALADDTHEQVQEIPEEEMVLSERIRDLLLKANGNEERLPAAVASECLLNAGLGLRFVQVPAMMSAIDEGEDGLVDSREVANAAAGIMCALKKIHARQLASAEDVTVKDFKASRRPEGLARVSGLDVDEFEVLRKRIMYYSIVLYHVFEYLDEMVSLVFVRRNSLRPRFLARCYD